MTNVAIGPLIDLLHLCDSLFPVGAFAHSDGLEAAVAEERVADAAGFCQWLDTCLHEALGDVDGPAVLAAWNAADQGRWNDLHRIDADVHALRPSSTARQASRAMGTRLLLTWRQLRTNATLEQLFAAHDIGRVATLPVAFGIVCASVEIDARSSVAAFIYTRLAATTSAAMRLFPLGQHEGHRLLAQSLEGVPGVVDRVLARGARPGAFMPAFDLAAMSHQYVHSRLFRS